MQMALRTEMGVSAGSVVRSISSRRAMCMPSAMARAIFIEVCVGEKQATQSLSNCMVSSFLYISEIL